MTKRVGKKVDREEEDFIQDLRTRNHVLQKENNSLQGKLKNASSTLKKYKQQLQSMKNRYSKGTLVKQQMKGFNENKNGCKISVDTINTHEPSCKSGRHQYDEDIHIVLSQLQMRLLESESELNSVREENEKMRMNHSEMEK